MNDEVQESIQDGNRAEAIIIDKYIKGFNGDYTVDYMRAISDSGVVFSEWFKYDGRRHQPDGYVLVGDTMHVFELKNGERNSLTHNGQVNRYANLLNQVYDFDKIITHIIYGQLKDFVVEEYDARDMFLVYAATRYSDDRVYINSVKRKDAMSEEDRLIRNEKQRVKGNEKNANRTPERKAADNDKQRVISAERRAKFTPEEKAEYNAKQRVINQKVADTRTPEERAEYNEQGRIRASKMPAEQKARYAEKQRITKANRTPEQVAVDREKSRIYMANRRAKLKALK